jgi:2-dehydro-3-deoxygluconokinase
MAAAKQAGAVVSFDLNFREKLWRASGGVDRARDVLTRIVQHVDVLLGNEEDLQNGLGVQGPEVRGSSPLETAAFADMIERVGRMFPNIRVVATSLREVRTANDHRWSAIGWIDGKTYRAPTMELSVLDRVGGGDGFASGLIYGLLTGESPETALRLGWAHGALMTTFPGDTTMANVEQVRALAGGGSARIQR